MGTRPRVFVALGSHANYFTSGAHRFDPRIVEPVLNSVIRQKRMRPVDHIGSGAVVRPRLVRVTPATPSWMTFAGAWGAKAWRRSRGVRLQPDPGLGLSLPRHAVEHPKTRSG